jgi:hypothetical protein
MTPEEKISQLLRLKRHEQPRPGYFEDFLQEFQSRQRAELLRRPLWAIAWDRLSAMVPSLEVPRLAYAGAIALAASAAILIQPAQPGVDASGGALASAPSQSAALTLASPQSVTIGESVPAAMTSTGSPSVHYVLPSRPASYASSRSF